MLNPVTAISEGIGTTQPAIRLLLTLVIAYPLAFIHRRFFYDKSPTKQHLFFILVGLYLSWFNFGLSSFHCIFSVCFMYAVWQVFGGKLITVYIAFTFNIGYLLLAVIYTASDSYDIIWTTQQCVLALRLIGLSIDLYDGQKAEKNLSIDQKHACQKTTPGFIEVISYCLFFGGFLIGPQFSLKRYQNFVNGVHLDKETREPASSSTKKALQHLATGVAYIIAHQILSSIFSSSYLITDGYQMLPFWKKSLIIAFWCRGQLYKYIGCWLLAEGSCTLAGLSYNGKDGNGKDLWDGCINVKLLRFESSYTFQHCIDSFNINTNRWVANYVYKRLKFLNNKIISQVSALVFLAVWHGYYSGYYACFFMELITMTWDKQCGVILMRSPTVVRFYSNKTCRYLMITLRWVFIQVMIGYCLTPFVFLTFSRWWQVWKAMNFCGLIIFCPWPLVAPLLKYFVTPKRVPVTPN